MILPCTRLSNRLLNPQLFDVPKQRFGRRASFSNHLEDVTPNGWLAKTHIGENIFVIK
jgi:hypothetical protein